MVDTAVDSAPDTGETAETGETGETSETGETGETGDTGLGLGDFCDPETDGCPEGSACCAACCIPDLPPVCTTLDEDGECPEPDLFVDADALASSVIIEQMEFEADGCAVQEGCVNAPGLRTILRFTTRIPNVGTADAQLGFPGDRPDLFVYSECHAHYHLDNFADYALIDGEGTVIPAGHKQAFCLMDAEPYDGSGTPAYTCANQGISVGWADTYPAGIDCQWIDITDVTPGTYQLQVAIDPTDFMPDKDPSNDTVAVEVVIP